MIFRLKNEKKVEEIFVEESKTFTNCRRHWLLPVWLFCTRSINRYYAYKRFERERGREGERERGREGERERGREGEWLISLRLCQTAISSHFI